MYTDECTKPSIRASTLNLTLALSTQLRTKDIYMQVTAESTKGAGTSVLMHVHTNDNMHNNYRMARNQCGY